VLGGVSLISANDLFFKLKPALLQFILLIFLGLSLFTPFDPIRKMLSRIAPGGGLADRQYELLRPMIRLFFWVFAGHTLLIVYAAFYLSTGWWSFIAGGLFYILIALVFAIQMFRQRLMGSARAAQDVEWLPVVDKEGKILSRASRQTIHADPELLHPVVYLHVFNSKRQLFLQRRSQQKELYPGLWDSAVGGHVRYGEKVDQALLREALEEIGWYPSESHFLARYLLKTERQSELAYVFVCWAEGPFSLNRDEISEGSFWAHQELMAAKNQKIFTPNLEKDIQLFEQNGFFRKTRH
jgi:isopentenyldiphosphate isomerase